MEVLKVNSDCKVERKISETMQKDFYQLKRGSLISPIDNTFLELNDKYKSGAENYLFVRHSHKRFSDFRAEINTKLIKSSNIQSKKKF